MSRVDAAASLDRLPWLQDDRFNGAEPRFGLLAAALAAILLAGGAYLVVAGDVDRQAPATAPASRPAATVKLPSARPVEVEPIVAPPLPIVEAPPTEAAQAQPWPVRQIAGAAGRLIRVGAYGSVHQAKRGWWAIVRRDPTLEHLPALVVPVRPLTGGGVYYRLQMGTTSRADSAALCKQMRAGAQPCVVL